MNQSENLVEKRRNTRETNGYLGDKILEINLKAYDEALRSKDLLKEEFWYQSVVNGGRINQRASLYSRQRKRSLADYITRDIFSKCKNRPEKDEENELVILSNEVYCPERFTDLTRLWVDIFAKFESKEEQEIFAYFLRISGIYALMIREEQDIVINRILDLIHNQEESSPYPKTGLIKQFPTRYQCDLAIKRFKRDYAEFLPHMLVDVEY